MSSTLPQSLYDYPGPYTTILASPCAISEMTLMPVEICYLNCRTQFIAIIFYFIF